MTTNHPRHKREIAFQEEMKAKGIDLVYEPRFFCLSNGSRYTPDFYDPIEDKYYELISTRQRWQQCKDKLRLFQVEYPEIKFEIVKKYKKKVIKSKVSSNVSLGIKKLRTMGRIRDIAKKTGVSEGALSHYFTGRRKKVSPENALKISATYPFIHFEDFYRFVKNNAA